MIARLQIYKDAYSLTKRLYVAISTMERLHKHTMGARLLDVSLDMFKWIALANQAKSKEERLKYLDSFIGTFEQFKTYIRLCNDLKLLKLSVMIDMQLTIDSVSKQLRGWRDATSRV